MIEAAALMALLVQDWGDFSIIMGLLIFNAVLGFWEEHEASNALAALKGALASKAPPYGNANGKRSTPPPWCPATWAARATWCLPTSG